MRTIFIIHGSYGNPQENWFPWLKAELEKQGESVTVPRFKIPTNDQMGHSLDDWLNEFDKYKTLVNDKTIFVAHSRGCSFTFQLLPKLGVRIDSLFLVGPFVDYDQWRPDIYSEYDSFQAKPYLWKRLRQLVRHVEVFQSTDDVIPVSEGQFIADWLKAEIHIFKNAGHFNVATYPKFTQFPELLDRVKLRL
ncbi:hypothetical protein COY90_01975 [Candidatus Roizmanbacteria bacterium CG_4_10_14_0_8_um_filter_39_9]|uniref:Alpha/beta hydrolase n=1 Tax=Candidatus Roizmanbacteria bacterium CG_4_10_14_0_8_um_filter_39_9 TaxID=1974829 RepID=A0A2M7QEM5_9BACT|nr:MAG: hypothetical protein COY90_01975 [Candidatus Roizmanbacteria bacterium CG_4_10_14_0_8_um_filter_39_9]